MSGNYLGLGQQCKGKNSLGCMLNVDLGISDRGLGALVIFLYGGWRVKMCFLGKNKNLIFFLNWGAVTSLPLPKYANKPESVLLKLTLNP